jgi:hypothetical protein
VLHGRAEPPLRGYRRRVWRAREARRPRSAPGADFFGPATLGAVGGEDKLKGEEGSDTLRAGPDDDSLDGDGDIDDCDGEAGIGA